MVNDDDASQYLRECAIAALIIVGAYTLFITELISSLILFIIVAVTLPRWIINVHELLHAKSSEQINGIIRCLGISPVPLSIFTLSYQQIHEIHLAHHRHAATESDPDAYHIRGNLFLIILNSLTTPEQSFLRWVKINGFSPQLGIDLLIKLLFLVILALLGGKKFLFFLLFIRIVYGLGDLVFFRLVHHQKGEYGTFEMKLPSIITTWGERIFGRTVIQATINHDVHHQNPRIAAHNLAKVREHIMVSCCSRSSSG
nr:MULTISPECIES: fatty acid desaturase [Nostocaceae]